MSYLRFERMFNLLNRLQLPDLGSSPLCRIWSVIAATNQMRSEDCAYENPTRSMSLHTSLLMINNQWVASASFSIRRPLVSEEKSPDSLFHGLPVVDSSKTVKKCVNEMH
jgi:hypothetical protein